jgi:tight adherence protein C
MLIPLTCIGLSVACLAYVIAQRLVRAGEISGEQARGRGLLAGLVAPVAAMLRNAKTEMVAERVRENNQLLAESGGDFWGGLDGVEVLSARITLPLVVPPLVWLVGALSFLGGLQYLVLLGMVAGLFMLPSSALKGQAEQRQKQYQKQFPNALDLLTISVECGLTMQTAIDHLVRVFVAGPVREEMAIVQHQVRLGKRATEALSEMGKRINIPAVSGVLATVTQAMEMGTSIAPVMRQCATEMRRKRVLAAEEEASKAVVKMTLPTVVLILPGVFVVLLGPVIIEFVRMWHAKQ